MKVPLEIQFHQGKSSPGLRAHIEERAARLDQLHGNLISCRTVIDRPRHHKTGLNGWQIKVELLVPRHELVVTKDTSEDPISTPESARAVIDEAFDSIETQLKKLVQKQKGEVKHHESQTESAVIESLSEDHGFLREGQGSRLIYFHRNSVVGQPAFQDLVIGSKVEFAEEQGAEGPQARFVSVKSVPAAAR